MVTVTVNDSGKLYDPCHDPCTYGISKSEMTPRCALDDDTRGAPRTPSLSLTKWRTRSPKNKHFTPQE